MHFFKSSCMFHPNEKERMRNPQSLVGVSRQIKSVPLSLSHYLVITVGCHLYWQSRFKLWQNVPPFFISFYFFFLFLRSSSSLASFISELKGLWWCVCLTNKTPQRNNKIILNSF